MMVEDLWWRYPLPEVRGWLRALWDKLASEEGRWGAPASGSLTMGSMTREDFLPRQDRRPPTGAL
ncbi:hypothetical protein ACGF13_10315 [Kitasatospora sp. NPDC048286]|uniref:hypothetical protein n=1 Tax=Kitasatospora sp. NPDC048286 TaxID=3364047 RepID=UPI0037134BBC